MGSRVEECDSIRVLFKWIKAPLNSNITLSVSGGSTVGAIMTINTSCPNAHHMAVHVVCVSAGVDQWFQQDGTSMAVSYTLSEEGTYTITAAARNTAGENDPGTERKETSTTVNVTEELPATIQNQPDSFNITGTYTQGQSINISVQWSLAHHIAVYIKDPDGIQQWIEQLGEHFNYDYTLEKVGMYEIYAAARDTEEGAGGLRVESTHKSIQVQAGSLPVPIVYINNLVENEIYIGSSLNISVTGTNCEKIEAFIAKCNGAAEDDDPETEENYTSMGEQSGENYSKSQTITECGYYHVKAVGKNGSWINGGLTDEVKVDMVAPNLYSLTVKLAQTCLQKLKDGGVIPGIDLGAAGLDGKWGSNTQNSVQKFQLWYNDTYSGNLRTDGILDRQISDLLFAEEMKVPAIITPTINFNPDPPRKDEQTIITADCGEDVQSIKITVNNPQNNVQTFDNSGVCSVYSIQYTPTMEGNYTVTATVNNNDSSKATKTFLIAGTGGGTGNGSNPYNIFQNEYNMVLQNAQKYLNSLGYNCGTPDGLWGPNTKSAVNSFQRANSASGLTETEYLDQKTYNLLFEKWDQQTGGPSDFWASRINTWINPLKGGPTEDPQGAARYFGASRENGARAHAGMDYFAEPGREVVAMTSGTVLESRYFDIGTYQVVVQHDDGTIARYTELYPNPNLAVGQRVSQGDTLGKLIPNTTSERTCMLHLEVYKGDLSGSLTNTSNVPGNYLYVNQANYQRRYDLIDPTDSRYLRVVYPEFSSAPSVSKDKYQNVDISGLGATVTSVSSLANSGKELDILARTIFGECCSGYADYGQEAVAWAIINRKESGLYRSTYEGCCLQSGQFAAVTGPDSDTQLARSPLSNANNLDAWRKAVYIARLILEGRTSEIPNPVGISRDFRSSSWFEPVLDPNYVQVEGYAQYKLKEDGQWKYIKNVKKFGDNYYFEYGTS